MLLFGMPRSGTTWLAKILDSHPHTLYRHEPDSYGRMNFLPMAPAVADSATYERAIREFYAGLPDIRDTKVSATAPMFRKSYEGWMPAAWNAVAVAGSKLASRALGELRVPLWLTAAARREARLVAKSIESVARLGVVASALPEARLVLILRHPHGFVASMLRGKSARHFSDSDSIGEDARLLGLLVQSDIGRQYGLDPVRLADISPVQRLAWQWVLTNDKALADTAQMDNVRVLRYEDLCAEPGSETGRLFDWLGLDMPDQTRAFIDRSTSTHRGRYYSVFKDPARVAHAWRKELEPRQQAAVWDVVSGSRAAAHFPDSP